MFHNSIYRFQKETKKLKKLLFLKKPSHSEALEEANY